jgi:hypothetical protein
MLLILFAACVRPEPEFEGSWLEELIYHLENGTDTTGAQAIFSYEYDGEPVYYLLSLGGVDENTVHDTNGTRLGAPDGGYYQDGDGTLPNFFETATDGELIWHADFPTVKNVSDEYQVYNAALSCRFQHEPFLHVHRKTQGETEQFYYRDELDVIDYDSLMIGDYLIRNFQEIILDTTMMIKPVETVHEAVINAIWNTYEYPANWQYYYNQYPESNGLITLSRPGFSSDGKTAVVKLGWQFSGDGGLGYIFVLKKYDDIWLVRYSFNTWVS